MGAPSPAYQCRGKGFRPDCYRQLASCPTWQVAAASSGSCYPSQTPTAVTFWRRAFESCLNRWNFAAGAGRSDFETPSGCELTGLGISAWTRTYFGDGAEPSSAAFARSSTAEDSKPRAHSWPYFRDSASHLRCFASSASAAATDRQRPSAACLEC